MSYEAAIVERLKSRLSNTGIRRLTRCRAVTLDVFRTSWLSATGCGASATLADLAVSLADALHVRTKLVGERLHNMRDGVIVISNHVGAAKLLKVTRREVESTLPDSVRRAHPMTGRLLNSDSFLVLFAPPIVATLEALAPTKPEFIPISVKYEGSFGIIAQAHGFVQIGERRLSAYSSLRSQVLSRVTAARERGALPIVIIFPEGGTTGKRLTADPFRLEPFQSGFFHLSQHVGLPILPIVVTFNDRFEFLSQVLFTADFATRRCTSPVECLHQDMQWNITRALNATA